MVPLVLKIVAATFADAVSGIRSLNARMMSSPASGMNWLVNTCRKDGSSLPHPSSMSFTCIFRPSIISGEEPRLAQPRTNPP